MEYSVPSTADEYHLQGMLGPNGLCSCYQVKGLKGTILQGMLGSKVQDGSLNMQYYLPRR